MTTTKHTLTTAIQAAKEAQESGDYYVGTFFEHDPTTDDAPTTEHEARQLVATLAADCDRFIDQLDNGWFA